jgi:hypothetical protein
VAFNPIRRTEVEALLAKLRISEPSIEIETPLLESKVGEVISKIESLLFSFE